MAKISAVIITLNEERNIRRCLDSLANVADEIVVLDSFSSDKTAAICSEYSIVNFFQREWQGYAATKNYANSLAQHPYILTLDADEALSEKLQKNISDKKNSLHGAYKFSRLTNYCGKWIYYSGWYPDYKLRLYPKDKGIWKGDFVHEIMSVGDAEIKIIKGDLLHYSYYSVEEHYSRVEKYSTLSAQEKMSRGEKGSSIKGFFSALSRFIKIYFFKKGFLDGIYGLRIAFISAYAVWLRQKKLLQLERQKKE